MKYWLWLQCCLGTDSKKLRPAVEFFGSAENIYNAKESDYRYAGFFSERDIAKLNDKSLDYCEKTIKVCIDKGYDVIPFGSKEYPSRLAEIPTPPVVLYIYGKLPQQERFYVGMVGTRNPDETGKQLAYNFGYDLAKERAVIVSGGAYGIDIFSHMGCVDAGGATVCIIGCGIDRFVSKVSKYLLDEVPKNGAVVSEYPPGYPPTVYTFPTRDRIISGMSDCTLVVQAGMGSGALITAKFAVEQNRKIFSVPGNVSHKNSTGSNFLIKNGFSAALSYKDITLWNESRMNGSVTHDKPFPVTDMNFFRQLALKVDKMNMRSSSERRLQLPVGYEVFASLDSNYIEEHNIDEDQMTMPDNKNDVPDTEEKIISAEETVTIEEDYYARAERELAEDKIIEDEVDIELAKMKDEDFTSLRGMLHYRIKRREMIEEKKKARGRFRDVEFDRLHPGELSEELLLERDIIRLTELSVRQLKGEPEPRGSYILEKMADTVESEEHIRVMQIDRLTKKLNLGSGIYELKRASLKKMFESSVKYDLSENAQQKIPENKNNRKRYTKSEVKRNRSKKTEENIAKSDKNTSNKEQKQGKNGKNNENENKILSEQLTENASAVYYTISDTPVHVDIIKLNTGLDVHTVLSVLTELEIFGLVEKLPGRRYVRKS